MRKSQSFIGLRGAIPGTPRANWATLDSMMLAASGPITEAVLRSTEQAALRAASRGTLRPAPCAALCSMKRGALRPEVGSAATWVLAVATALAMTGCHAGKVASAPPAVVVALPVHPDAGTAGGLAIRYPVEVAARYSNPMSFRVPGKVIERKVRIGDAVKNGEVVARLDPVDAEKQAASAQAALDAAEHRLVFAKQQLDRDTAQAAQNLIAANQLEQTQDAYSAAQASREEAAAQRVVARNNLQYNTLVADHDGVITSENADTGQVVAAGQAVYGLAWSGDTDVTLDAAASDLERIAIGQAASVTFPALPDHSFAARVREITPAADPQSRTYRVKLTLEQPGSMVRLGMTGDAVLAPIEGVAGGESGGGAGGTSGAARGGVPGGGAGGASGAAAGGMPAGVAGAASGATRGGVFGSVVARRGAPMFTVPATAIFHKGNAPAVWVINANSSTLELRPVAVRSYTDHSTIVTRGLSEGDTVVLAGVHTVYAGEKVQAVRPLFDGEGDVVGQATPGDAGTGAAGGVAATGGADAAGGAVAGDAGVAR
jgi:membrane fusion protein, multidrug efflux system